MKILEICRSFSPSIGGLENYIKERIELLKGINIQSQVITTNYLLSQKVSGDDVIRFNQFTKYNFIIENIFERIKDLEYDIISINQIGNYLSDYFILSNKYSNIKKILTPHFYFHTNKYKAVKKLYDAIFVNRLLTRVDKIVCFTNTEKKFWVNNYNVDPAKILVIPHQYLKKDSNTEISDQNYFLYIGRESKNKRLDLLLNLWSWGNIPYKLIVIGNHKKRSNIKNVKFEGEISEKRKNDLLSKCSALIFPSDHEAFGRVLLEASNFRKPILCSELDVFKDILNKDGYLSFKNNPRSILESIKHFLSLSNEEKKKMGEINYQNLSKFEAERIKKDYYNLFFNIL